MIKILYVDDELINLQLFEINFENKFKVLTANDGYAGLKIIDENPDTLIIISDMKMPNMSGLDFIKTAKEKYPDKKYYILTGFEITQEIKEALNNSLISKYFRKPFNMNELELEINNSANELLR